MKASESAQREILMATVSVSAPGNFVDIYDLILFAIVRGARLKDLDCIKPVWFTAKERFVLKPDTVDNFPR